MRCDYCGKKIGLFETKYVGKNKAMHVKCYEKYLSDNREKITEQQTVMEQKRIEETNESELQKLRGNEEKEKMEIESKPEFLDSYEEQKKLDTQPINREIKHGYTVFGILLRICGTLSAIICFFAGFSMTSIQSISGNTVAEAFYNAFGVFVIGLSFFILPLLFGIAYLIEKK